MKILLTGGNGFIGRNLKEQLGKKYDIIAPGRKDVDLTDEAAVGGLIKKEKFDIVIHSAKWDNVNHPATGFEILDHNLRMFFNLEKYKAYYGRMFYFGSGAEYARDKMHPLVTEEEFGQIIPEDAYGFAKYIMAKEAENSDNIYNFRLFGVYGKYEAWERRFISNAICRALAHKPISIEQNVFFDYLYIDDLVRIVDHFIIHPPRKKQYNICRGESRDLLSIAMAVKKAAESPFEIQVKREGQKAEYSGNNERMLEELGGFEFTGMEESIDALIGYYKERAEILNSLTD